jgi:chaperonin GroEL (HSP60 family)
LFDQGEYEFGFRRGDEVVGVLDAFADALEEIPMTLAENSGFNPIEYLQKIKKM